MPAPASGLLIAQRPAPVLARFVDRYWLCANNRDRAHLVLPDGCIDLVLEWSAASGWRGLAYGSTTRPTVVPCVPGHHYLGLRFKPAQSRHFLATCASELTDRCEDARHLLRRHPLAAVAEGAGEFPDAEAAYRAYAAFAAFDRWLLTLLRHREPEPPNAAELMVRHIEAAHGALRIDTLAQQLGKSPRQLQRLFLEQVGVSAKFFACVVRVQHAQALIATSPVTGLADIAAQTGYADQAHMTRDFARLAGSSPAGQAHVAFLQDAPAPAHPH